ncbi:hypothetical protein D9619_001209 [Psilocybe cf. subviscida]|uniref:Uncharacterized protein n=1 Tax=Psilocybe cf. subviscida TaxID=2480587 RepID=A0A8H5BCL7_9AGAR|nr:hypothetical protein D9619_001209 [Psilocybe cf. subviscida]
MAATTTHMNNMNGMNTAMSVDDLVNSFGASSIGQEARDLAALQVSLSSFSFLFLVIPCVFSATLVPSPDLPSSFRPTRCG